MNLWLIYDSETGEELYQSSESSPEINEGEEKVLIPASSTGPDPFSEWSPSLRTFIEIPRKSTSELLSLFSPQEIEDMVTAGSLDVLRLLIGINSITAPIKATESFFVSGVNAAVDEEILSSSRAEDILSFTPFS